MKTIVKFDKPLKHLNPNQASKWRAWLILHGLDQLGIKETSDLICYMHPFPPVHMWWTRNMTIYWQTYTDERRYGDGFASLAWFDQSKLADRVFVRGI